MAPLSVGTPILTIPRGLHVRRPKYDLPMASDPAARLLIALELHDLGERMQRQRLRRARPQITPAELDHAIRSWLLERPGAEYGDAVGPRSSRLG
jgi:hypothetical protein